ncbi:SusC/RagA family TonB-linked outer membrane protein [Gemmatimonadetes bacterium T265]|nr:SusC/RagA family TonB-linked outer membrane protein [Gemmatimonadetes bacterium T265]
MPVSPTPTRQRAPRARIPRARSAPARAALAVLAAAVPGAHPAAAQTAPAQPPAARAADAQTSVAGTVVRAGTLTPVEGAQVLVEGTTIGATTDAAGRFRLRGVPADAGGQVTLRVRRLSFQPFTQRVRVGAGDLRLVLTEATVNLDAVVVTGTAGGEQQRSVGNAVSRIDAAAEVGRTGVTSVGQLLNGRAPGVIVTSGTGRAGSGPDINIRGRSTISLNQQPLLYIDGVRVDNDVGTGTRQQGGAVASRFNDIPPEDIESIEIIKGPAAATIYGTEAANGVIQVITKRGQSGERPQWNAVLRQGTVAFQDPGGRIQTNYAQDSTGQLLTWNGVQQEAARGTPIFTTGRLQTYQLNLSGGTPAVRYYASGGYDQNTGIEPNNNERRFNGRLNLSVTPSSKVDVTASLGVISGHTALGSDYGASALFSTLYGSPNFVPTPTRGFFLSPPQTVWDVYSNTQDVNRYTSSLAFNNRPTGWFTQSLNLGLDLTNEDNQGLQRFASPSDAIFFSPTDALGSILEDLRTVSYITASYNASARAALTPALTATSSVGAQFYRRRVNLSQVNGSQFPAPGVTTGAAAAITTGSQDYLINKTLGFYAQEQFGLHDRAFLTAAVRVDNNSAFGKNFGYTAYPKVAATWVISEEPWWRDAAVGGAVNQLKLRSAFGASGQQPSDSAALRTYQPVTSTQDRPGVTPQFVGNDNLKPERGQELELGFEAGLFRRLSLDFTYFNKKVHDAILARPNAPSGGFPGSQFVNIGQISNHGVELAARYDAFQRSDLGIELTGNVGTARDRIDDLGGIPFVAIPGLPQRDVQGYPIAAYFAKKVVGATLGANGAAANLQCDNGAGGVIGCDAAPVVFLGTSTPKVVGAFGTTVTVQKRLRLYGLVDFKAGHKLLNADELLRCSVLGECLANYRPQQFSPTYIADVQNGSGLLYANSFVQSASFARLREVSATYDLPARFAAPLRARSAALTIAGRNLHLWTSYKGLDPESRAGVIGQQSAFSQAVTPTLAQLLASISLRY